MPATSIGNTPVPIPGWAVWLANGVPLGVAALVLRARRTPLTFRPRASDP